MLQKLQKVIDDLMVWEMMIVQIDCNQNCVLSMSGFSFNEVSSIRKSNSKVVSCHFSSDGKLLASAGHDKKV